MMKKFVVIAFGLMSGCLINMNVHAQSPEARDRMHDHWINYQQKSCANNVVQDAQPYTIHIHNGNTDDAFFYQGCNDKKINSVPVDVGVSDSGQNVTLHLLGREVELRQFQPAEIVFENGQGTKSSFVFEYH